MNFYKYRNNQQDGLRTFGVLNLDMVCDLNKVALRNPDGTLSIGLVINFAFPIDKTKTFVLEAHKSGEAKRLQTKIIRVPYSVVIEDLEDVKNILTLMGIEDSEVVDLTKLPELTEPNPIQEELSSDIEEPAIETKD